jgi:hypothetical protein
MSVAPVCLAALLLGTVPVQAEQLPPEVRKAVDDGLKYLAKQQHEDGHWSASGQGFSTAMTAVAGMAFLMEGSTCREGKYRDNLRRAANWLMAQSLPNGLIANLREPSDAQRYMYGHGFSILFLSQVYGEEEEGDRRKKLEDILTRGVQFTRLAQTERGGWGYISARDGQGFDEGSVTVTQVQALRAARNAGIAVPAEAITDAVKYLKESTDGSGGVIYSLAHGSGGGGRPALTCAAIACGFNAGEYNNPLVKKWVEFVRRNAPMLEGHSVGRFGMHDEYVHYYYGQSVYFMGDEQYAKMFPSSKEAERVTWSKYKKENFDRIVKMQQSDGSWSGAQAGTIFATSIYLSILQLDLAALPIYQR